MKKKTRSSNALGSTEEFSNQRVIHGLIFVAMLHLTMFLESATEGRSTAIAASADVLLFSCFEFVE